MNKIIIETLNIGLRTKKRQADNFEHNPIIYQALQEEIKTIETYIENIKKKGA